MSEPNTGKSKVPAKNRVTSQEKKGIKAASGSHPSTIEPSEYKHPRNFKEVTSHPIIILLSAGAAAVVATWAIVDHLLISPLKDERNTLRESLNGKKLGGSVVGNQDAPNVLDYQQLTNSELGTYGAWLNGLVAQLAIEGSDGEDAVSLRIKFAEFPSGYRPFNLEIVPLSQVKITGGYSFLIRKSDSIQFIPLPIDYSKCQIEIPASEPGDTIIILLNAEGPKNETTNSLITFRKKIK